MKLEEFNQKYNNYKNTGVFYGAKYDVEVVCEYCGKSVICKKFNAEENIRRNEKYKCRSCGLTLRHIENPVSEATREKQRNAKLGYKMSEETKEKISISKKSLYSSADGELLKNALSIKAAKQHEDGAFPRTVKGYFESKKSKSPLYFSSSYELRLIYMLENNPDVKEIKTQISIEIHGKGRCVDAIAEYINGNIIVFEVKPFYNIENCYQQISDIKEYALQQGWNFQLWSETDSGLEGDKAIWKWAIDYLPYCISNLIVENKKEKNRNKAIKHYNEKIATNTITFPCDYCKCDHTALRLTYDKNIDRNGRYICEKEGGHIAGSKPKLSLRKINPYSAEGKKKCNACQQILLLNEFGDDKGKADGKATRCKACRAKKATEKYQLSKIDNI